MQGWQTPFLCPIRPTKNALGSGPKSGRSLTAAGFGLPPSSQRATGCSAFGAKRGEHTALPTSGRTESCPRDTQGLTTSAIDGIASTLLTFDQRSPSRTSCVGPDSLLRMHGENRVFTVTSSLKPTRTSIPSMAGVVARHAEEKRWHVRLRGTETASTLEDARSGVSTANRAPDYLLVPRQGWAPAHSCYPQ